MTGLEPHWIAERLRMFAERLEQPEQLAAVRGELNHLADVLGAAPARSHTIGYWRRQRGGRVRHLIVWDSKRQDKYAAVPRFVVTLCGQSSQLTWYRFTEGGQCRECELLAARCRLIGEPRDVAAMLEAPAGALFDTAQREPLERAGLFYCELYGWERRGTTCRACDACQRADLHRGAVECSACGWYVVEGDPINPCEHCKESP